MATTTVNVDLKKNGFLVTRYPLVSAPGGEQPYQLNLTHLAEHREGEYSANNSIVCWVMDGEIYAAPYTRKLMQLLSQAGFRNGSFYVPFSNGEHPYRRNAEWQSLLLSADIAIIKDYEEDAKAWCDEHHIGSINKNLLDSCLKVPRGGIPVESGGIYSTYYPALNEACIDIVTIDRLGSYSYNAGRVAFIYRDGHTYISKDPSIIDTLEKAGYRRDNFLVPLSGSEKITDVYLRQIWDNIPEASR